MNKWVVWEPYGIDQHGFQLKSFIDDAKKFSITLTNIENSLNGIIIDFDGAVLSYQISHLFFLKNMFASLEASYGKDFTTKTFFKIHNSVYSKKLSINSCDIYKASDFTHFVFITKSFMIEILDWRSQGDPVITKF